MLDLPFEMLDSLPVASRLKLERFANDRAAARAVYLNASDRMQEAIAALGEATGQETSQRANNTGIHVSPRASAPISGPHHDWESPEDLESRISAPVKAARRTLQLATDARDRAEEQLRAFDFVGSIETWLRRTASPGASFREARPIDLKITARTDLVAEVAKVRSQVAALDEKFAAIENAPVPANDLKARAFAEVDRIAAAGALKVHPASRSAEPLGLARKLALGTGSGGSIVGTGGTDIFVWLLRDQMKAAIASQIDQFPASGALSDDEREQAFRQIAEQRLELERIEELLIGTAETDSRYIARRADADPRAVLGIEA